MVRGNKILFCKAGISKFLSDILVCPLSKQPLRHCPKSNSLISDEIGVSYSIIDGIPCLHPKEGKLLDVDATPESTDAIKSPSPENQEPSRED